MLDAIAFLTIIFLFFLSAFWSGTETAVTSLSKYRIRKMIALNKSLAGPLKQWLQSPYYLLTTILVGNTLTNMFLSIIATALAFRAFSTVNREALETAVWLLITVFILIFGEITPKVFSRAYPEKVTLSFLPVMAAIIKATRPLVWPFVKITGLLSPKTSLAPVSRLAYTGVEEIRCLISQAHDKGMLGRETSQMLQRVAGIGDMSIEKIMTPKEKMEAVNLNQDPEKFIDLLISTGQSRVPVYHDNLERIAGFVYLKDLLWAWKNKQSGFSDELIRPPYFVKNDKKIYELLREFQSGQTHLAFVNDAFGNLAGIVTLEDLLEEIVGEILDEYDLKDQEGGKS